MFKEYFALFGSGGVDEYQCVFVPTAIAHAPHHFIVGSEEGVTHVFAEIRRQHGTKIFAFVIAIENLCVYAVDDGINHAQTPLVVGGPSLIIAGIFGQEREFARVEIEAIGIEGFGVATIHLDEDLSRHFRELIEDAGAHAREIGVGAFVASVAANAEKVIVLVTALVFGINQSFIVGPKVAAETAIGLAREANGGAELPIGGNAAHKEVHAITVRGKIGKVVAVGRQTVGGRFGVAKEIF